MIPLIEVRNLAAHLAGTHRRLRAVDVLSLQDPAGGQAVRGGCDRNVTADHLGVDPERFTSHTLGAMRAVFPEAGVTGYEHLIATLDNHPKDRHVAATAIAPDAAAIVTENVRPRTLDAHSS